MPFSTEVPQDIIDTIIDELRGNNDALKSCATVSRSFLQPSRKNLFMSIRLDSLEKIERLQNILMSIPDISSYIHELTLSMEAMLSAESHGPLTEDSDRALTSILRLIPCPRSLLLGISPGERAFVKWTVDFSDNLKSALIDIFHSNTLNSVEINLMTNLPLSILNAFTHVKRLRLSAVALVVPSLSPAWVLPQIEALDLTIAVQPLHFPQISFSFPKLRYLSIGWHNEGFFQQVIASAARSIRHVKWICQRPQIGNVDLGVIANLHVLTLGWSLYDHQTIFPLIVNHLRNPAITRVLQELAIGLQMETNAQLSTLPLHVSSPEWEDFDATLSSLRTLQSVLFWVDIRSPSISSAELQAMIQGCLPRLANRGILSVDYGSKDDLGRRQ